MMGVMLSTIILSLLLGASAGASDAKADAIAAEVMEALGGQENWDRARFLRFTFVRRGLRLNITWDRFTGRYRLEAKTEAGVPYVVLMNVRSRQGKAYLEGRPVEDAELSEYLDRALRIWAGETYWLLMPFKMRDPGVVLSYAGEETEADTVYDVLHLRFEDVGLTPGDQYWAYINRETRLMDRWKLKLQGGYEGDFRWRGWERFGGILLSTERVGTDGEVIRFEDIVVSETMPDDVFTSPREVALP